VGAEAGPERESEQQDEAERRVAEGHRSGWLGRLGRLGRLGCWGVLGVLGAGGPVGEVGRGSLLAADFAGKSGGAEQLAGGAVFVPRFGWRGL
jgi:hypothetical protein